MNKFLVVLAFGSTLTLTACSNAVDGLIKAEARIVGKALDITSGIQEIRVKRHNAVVNSVENSCKKINKRGVISCRTKR